LETVWEWTPDVPTPAGPLRAGDLDGEGVEEIVVRLAPQRIVALRAEGQVLWQYEQEEGLADLFVIDLEGRGAADVLVVENPRRVVRLRGDGTVAWAWDGVPNNVNLVYADDLTGDGRSEIIVGYFNGYLALTAAGQLLWMKPGYGTTPRSAACGTWMATGSRNCWAAARPPRSACSTSRRRRGRQSTLGVQIVKGRTKKLSGQKKKSEQERHERVLTLLAEAYPQAACSLAFENPWQLLVATILAAQCTDERVNQVTPGLFARYRTPEEFADAPLEELEELIRPTGYYRHKARAIQACAEEIVEKYGGEVPAEMETLTQLPGVGRKTANVLLGNAFGVPGLTVDTHVQRLSQRLGLTLEKNPEKIEQDLMAIVPRSDWTIFSHRLIAHGRQVCTARRPQCETCVLLEVCPRLGVA